MNEYKKRSVRKQAKARWNISNFEKDNNIDKRKTRIKCKKTKKENKMISKLVKNVQRVFRVIKLE